MSWRKGVYTSYTQTNEPVYNSYVADVLAAVKGVSNEEITS